MLTRGRFLFAMLAFLASPRAAKGQTTKPEMGGGLISVLTEADLRNEPFECDCEFYRGNNAIGNTVFATRRQRKVAFVKIGGVVIQLTPVRTADLGCERGRTYYEQWRAGSTLVKLEFRAASPGEEACWYEGRLTVKAGNRTQALSVSGSCGC